MPKVTSWHLSSEDRQKKKVTALGRMWLGRKAPHAATCQSSFLDRGVLGGSTEVALKAKQPVRLVLFMLN